MITISLITGEDAHIFFGAAHTAESTFGTSDFSLNFDRGTIEQELVGQTGNEFAQGSLSIGGSLTNCKFAASGNSTFLDSIVDGTIIKISGGIDASSSLDFVFYSAQVTGYSVSIGDASTISEASIDFTIMNPKDVTYTSPKVTC